MPISEWVSLLQRVKLPVRYVVTGLQSFVRSGGGCDTVQSFLYLFSLTCLVGGRVIEVGGVGRIDVCTSVSLLRSITLSSDNEFWSLGL